MNFNHIESIKQICREKNISQKELAEKLNITPTTLSRNLSGNPTLQTLEKVAIALEVEPSEILFGIKEDHTQPKHICPHCGKELKITLE